MCPIAARTAVLAGGGLSQGEVGLNTDHGIGAERGPPDAQAHYDLPPRMAYRGWSSWAAGCRTAVLDAGAISCREDTGLVAWYRPITLRSEWPVGVVVTRRRPPPRTTTSPSTNESSTGLPAPYGARWRWKWLGAVAGGQGVAPPGLPCRCATAARIGRVGAGERGEGPPGRVGDEQVPADHHGEQTRPTDQSPAPHRRATFDRRDLGAIGVGVVDEHIDHAQRTAKVVGVLRVGDAVARSVRARRTWRVRALVAGGQVWAAQRPGRSASGTGGCGGGRLRPFHSGAERAQPQPWPQVAHCCSGR